MGDDRHEPTRATCSCGWVGPTVTDGTVAGLTWAHHLADQPATQEATT